jgi:hypothetical protein
VNWQSAGGTGRHNYVRLNRFVGMDPGRLEAAIPPVRDELAPVLASQPGCRGVFVGVNLEKGTGTVITLWESEGDLEASDPAEARARDQAVALAGASMGRGIVDTYRIVLEDETERSVGDVGCARLSRWEGISFARIIDAVIQFEEVDLPALREFPGFRGVFIAANPLLGNWLGLSLWRSREELEATTDWEWQVRGRIETKSGNVSRHVITDRYQVALAPLLRRFRTDWGDAA